MMLAIAIILGVAMLLNLIATEGNYNALMAAALVISIWDLNQVTAICVLSFLVITGIVYMSKN